MKYVVSLGGSLIVPQAGIDYVFLKKFRALILEEVNMGNSFVIISGGGKTARNYISAANRVKRVSRDDQDWLGIHSTRLNAHLLRTILSDVAYPKIIKDPIKDWREFKEVNSPVVIAGGWKPGHSTDYVAVILAKKFKADKILNLSNIDYVYDKDPSKYRSAKEIKRIKWSDFQKIVGQTWDPGLNAPFDPIASMECHKYGLEVIITNGKDLVNLRKIWRGKPFKGTVISKE